MSSDSGESHSSAHRNDREGYTYDGGTLSVEQTPASEESATDEVDQDDAGEELESLDNGTNGLTFARVRSRVEEHEEAETTSELSLRPRVERPGSPESTSTPDDTPSIQVGCATIGDTPCLMSIRDRDCLLLVAVSLSHIAPFDPTDRLHYSPLSAASHRAYRLLH